MTQVLGDYSSGILGDYDAQVASQSNQWLPNGNSYITAGNAFDMTGLVTTITLKDLLIDTNDTFSQVALLYQGTTSVGDLGIRYFSSGILRLNYKNVSHFLLLGPAITDQWPDGIITGELTVVANETLETWELYSDSVLINSGVLTLSPGYVQSGRNVFIGAQPNSDDIGETDAFPSTTTKAQPGWRIGNIDVVVDGSQVIDLVMPTGTATNVPDLAGNNDGTLRLGTGDGSDWGQILSAENTSSASTTETGQVLGGLMPGNNVSSPSTNELAVMSTALISGLDSTSASSSEFGSMVSQIIFGSSEISGSNYQIGTMTTNGLISGLNVRSGSTTEEGLLVTAIINASDSVSISSTQQGIMNTALISGLNSISASNTEIGILTTVKYNSNRIMVIGA